jgi:hypothetical protein
MRGREVKRNSQKIVMHACERCGGAAYLEDPHEDDWRCLQCARSVPSPLAAARPAPSATRRPVPALSAA